MLVYMALLGLLMGGAILAAYQLLEDATATRIRVNTDEEANFMLRKVDWALSGATSISSPSAGSSGDTLTVAKPGIGSITIALDGTDMEITRGGDTLPLNSANVTVDSLIFTQIAAVPPVPAAVQVSTTINGRSYGLTKYLR
ncbi:MAG: hypothetical protein A2855_00940 [Candidatus Liptonbacteria bacterium RIFCSPHIGHO2_01_FULL_57_28]|uniref:General secretion pathway GspH domain-containing protein n=1 Tax=Candidatus Liptonbacteria bacterium RIFCSPHIGHO2_01_FULL_57_28 TaxID=1798647 RepID=A0A1G2C9L7_9BACT|nr:MAG: hypothetical protein A2855_00940 [Candidatus Liptonbacteria bacterium RIFCSPHIGHO2_01_FULL_57_28]